MRKSGKGPGKIKKSHSKKTAKRLAIKQEMLAKKANKKGK